MAIEISRAWCDVDENEQLMIAKRKNIISVYAKYCGL